MDILTIGSCTMDNYLKLPSQQGISSIAQNEPKLCFYHGSKIAVEKFASNPGGNALNVAIGTSKMGLKSKIYTEMGKDDFTDDIVRLLKKNKVDTKLCIKNKDKHNNIGTIVVYQADRTIFSYHENFEYKAKEWGKPKMIYYTSMPRGNQTFQKILVNYLNQNKHTILSVNPGSSQIKEGIENLVDILFLTDILFVNKQEAAFLTKTDLTKNDSVEYLHKKLQKIGPKLTVITDGKNGASASNMGKVVYIKAFSDDKPIEDMTGAGDAFSSGFLSAIFHKKPLKEALLWGAINSASVIKEIGSTNGLLDKKTIEAIVASIKS